MSATWQAVLEGAVVLLAIFLGVRTGGLGLGLWGAAVATAFAMIFEATALSFTVWRKLGIVMAIFVPATLAKRGT